MNGKEEILPPNETESRQLVTFRVQSLCYAVPIETVAEMTQLRDVNPIIGAPPWIAGMMKLRNTVIPILDLRSKLNLQNLAEEVRELEAKLQKLKNGHVIWLQTLEDCCATGTQFELQTDPTQCGLGLWLSTFETEDAVLMNQISKFYEPHDAIHALAKRCLDISSRGDKDGAQKIINSARETILNEIIRNFDNTIRDIKERSRQMIVVLRGEKENLGLAVDQLESVTTVDDDHMDPRPLQDLESLSPDLKSENELFVSSVVRSDDDDELIQVLDVERVFASAGVSTFKFSQTALDDPHESGMGEKHG